jgi:hypothetical protein
VGGKANLLNVWVGSGKPEPQSRDILYDGSCFHLLLQRSAANPPLGILNTQNTLGFIIEGICMGRWSRGWQGNLAPRVIKRTGGLGVGVANPANIRRKSWGEKLRRVAVEAAKT